jgi:flagellar assembly protein FliH
VLVNPADIDTVRAAIGEMTSEGTGVELCDLQADERVGPGCAIVRTAEGEVDASVQTQLERAREVAHAAIETGERAA